MDKDKFSFFLGLTCSNPFKIHHIDPSDTKKETVTERLTRCSRGGGGSCRRARAGRGRGGHQRRTRGDCARTLVHVPAHSTPVKKFRNQNQPPKIEGEGEEGLARTRDELNQESA